MVGRWGGGVGRWWIGWDGGGSGGTVAGGVGRWGHKQTNKPTNLKWPAAGAEKTVFNYLKWPAAGAEKTVFNYLKWPAAGAENSFKTT